MAITRLVLTDFVIVQALDLDLAAGFTVLTGETGAGKSILIDALQLALGGRASADVIREGASKTEVVVEADLTLAATQWLTETGFDLQAEDPERVLVKRTVDASGKSKAWVNGSVATVAQLRELGSYLVEVYGQHAWTALLKESTSRQLFDDFARIDLSSLTSSWQAWRSAQRNLDLARTQSKQRQASCEQLSWRISEVDKLAPADGEWPELNAEHGRLAHSHTLLEACVGATTLLEGGEDDREEATTHPALTLLHQAQAMLSAQRHVEPEFQAVCADLEEGLASLESATRQLHALRHRFEPDPQRLADLDERLADWIGLAKRFKTTPESLYTDWTQWKVDLTALTALTDLEGLERTERAAWSLFESEGQRVSAQRKKACEPFASAITARMQELGMVGGCFDVALTPLSTPQAHGFESVTFLVAGHAGVTPKPLDKVASGGELSRLALAVAVVSTELSLTPTLIFDEIDSGIGGTTAQTVGRLMRQLGDTRQVLAVTHLAQVASCAHQHGVVQKRMNAKKTASTVVSEVQFVEGKAREREVARMLGSGSPSDAALTHARELLHSV